MGLKWGSLKRAFSARISGNEPSNSLEAWIQQAWKIHPLNMMAPLKGGLTIIAPAKLCSRMESTLTPTCSL